jgi:hypothetical protein
MSGPHTRRLVCSVSRLWSMASMVLTLKRTVPATCTAAAHNSRRWSPSSDARARRVRSSCPTAALVKKTEPTTKVTPTVPGSTVCA